LELLSGMGVPELWRHDGHRLQMYELVDSSYQAIQDSIALPGFTIEIAEAVLAKRFELGETAIIREFRQSLSN
jgi:hypothetical protein